MNGRGGPQGQRPYREVQPTAPYRFVPLNKKVVYPTWSENISFDAPLPDSISGEIEVTIEAKTPVFIKDHTSQEGQVHQFCHYIDPKTKEPFYFIPGSSIKGVIRTLVEVMSYSKLVLDDKKLAFRDLRNPAYKDRAMNTNKIYIGWLYKEGNRWKIDEVGKVANGVRIKYDEMKEHFAHENRIKHLIKYIKESKKAHEKYQKVKECINDIFLPLEKEGRNYLIVFTGSTGNKTREFIFPHWQHRERTYILDESVVKNFKSAYYLDNPLLMSEDWKKLWKDRFESGKKVPVFFQKDGDKIAHFGLSMLYKLPYKYSLLDLVKKYQDYKEDEADFAQTLFGYVEDEDQLRGRVQFSHFLLQGKPKFADEANLVLSSPRPTFYPYYLEQLNTKNGCRHYTYDDENAILRGHKFYPHRQNVIFDSGAVGTEAMKTRFMPLDKGSKFKGKVRFFNLKPVEVGAVLSALTFFGKGECWHKIGQGKPYGFGSVKIRVGRVKIIEHQGNKPIFQEKDVKTYINDFLAYLKKEIGRDLLQERRIETLLKIHMPGRYPDKKLNYLNNPQDFAQIKRQKKALDPYQKCTQSQPRHSNSFNSIRFKQSRRK